MSLKESGTNGLIDVLFVHHLPVIGGATQSLYTLIKSFTDGGLRCKVLFLSKSGNAISYYKSAGFDVDSIDDVVTYAHAYGAYNTFISRKPYRVVTKLIDTFRSVDKAKKYIEYYNPKVVYLNTSVLIPFAIAAKKLDVKVIWHLREQLHNGNLGLRKRLIRHLFKNYSDEIISISQVNAKALGLPNVHIIYNSVNMKIFNSDINSLDLELKYNLEGYLIISYIGGHLKSKGAPLFVKSALNVLGNYDNVKFVVAGEFNLQDPASQNKVEKEVQELIANSPVSDRVVFTGVLENVAALLAATDILVWPAIVPHFARPIMEAMVMGKPVIASNFMSSAEIVEDGVEGLLVYPDHEKFSKSIEHLIGNPDILAQMGKNAKIKGMKLFNSEINNLAILKIVRRYL